MSNRFHNCVNLQLEERLSKHSVVVFYDPRREFAPFIDELQEVGSAPEGIEQVKIGGLSTSLVRYQESFFAILRRSRALSGRESAGAALDLHPRCRA